MTPSVPVTVIVVDPITSGKFVMLHAAPAICPLPDVPWPVDHVTAILPLPPETEPPRFTLAAVVLLAGAVIVIVNGRDAATGLEAGVGAGADAVPACTAYNVCTVLTSSGDNPVTIW